MLNGLIIMYDVGDDIFLFLWEKIYVWNKKEVRLVAALKNLSKSETKKYVACVIS